MKLTALFTAQRGRGFLAALSIKEGRNYQFDFLRPTHSLFGYFNRLVEQYARVISPSKAILERCQENAQEGARWKILERATQHAKWERNKRERDQKREDEKEAERSNYLCLVSTYSLMMLLHSRLRRNRLARLCHRADNRVHCCGCTGRAPSPDELATS
jgi:hypothetical protein